MIQEKKKTKSRADRREAANSKRLKYAREMFKEVNISIAAAKKVGMDRQQQFEKGVEAGDILLKKLFKENPSSEERQLITGGVFILKRAMREAFREIVN